MAEELDDCEYWLPPQFLTEDDLLMDFKKGASKGNEKGMGLGRDFGVPQELGYGGFGAFLSSTSDLSSPVESLTETESDEDDFITGLTRKMAQSTLHDSVYDHENTKVLLHSFSPFLLLLFFVLWLTFYGFCRRGVCLVRLNPRCVGFLGVGVGAALTIPRGSHLPRRRKWRATPTTALGICSTPPPARWRG